MAEKTASVDALLDSYFGTFYLHAADTEMADVVLGRLAASNGPWVALSSHVSRHRVQVRLEVWDAEPSLDRSWSEWQHALLDMHGSRTLAISDSDEEVLEVPLKAPEARYWVRALAQRQRPGDEVGHPAGSAGMESWLLQLWPALPSASVTDTPLPQLLPDPSDDVPSLENRVRAGMTAVRESGWLEYLYGDITYNLEFAYSRGRVPLQRDALEHCLAYNDPLGYRPLTPGVTRDHPLLPELPLTAPGFVRDKQNRWHRLAAAHGMPPLRTIGDGVDFLLAAGVLIEDNEGLWPNLATDSLLHSGLLNEEDAHEIEYLLLKKQVPQLRDELVALLQSAPDRTWTGSLDALATQLSATPRDVRKAIRLGGKFAKSGEPKIRSTSPAGATPDGDLTLLL